MDHQQQYEHELVARQVRGLYNYQVGQKAPLGWLLIMIGIAAGGVFFLATLASTAQGIFEGLRRMAAH